MVLPGTLESFNRRLVRLRVSVLFHCVILGVFGYVFIVWSGVLDFTIFSLSNNWLFNAFQCTMFYEWSSLTIFHSESLFDSLMGLRDLHKWLHLLMMMCILVFIVNL